MITRKDLIDFCVASEACDAGLEWIQATPGTVKRLWETCRTPWILRWVLNETHLQTDVDECDLDEIDDGLYQQFAGSMMVLRESCEPDISDPVCKGYKTACRKYELGRAARLRVYDLKMCKAIRARFPWSVVETALKFAIKEMREQ